MTQRDRVRKLFLDSLDGIVQLYEILDLSPRITQYGRVLHELRTIELMDIENTIKWVNGVVHSSFKYTPSIKVVEEPSGQRMFCL